MAKEPKTDKKNDSDSGKKAARKSPPGWLKDIGYGQTVSLQFFKRNAWLLVSLLVAVVALMGLRYKTKTKMYEIRNLERELVKAESEKLREKASYMSLIRESEMQRMADERGLGLSFQEQPPYRLQVK